jgi:hypothetical protein
MALSSPHSKDMEFSNVYPDPLLEMETIENK